MQIKVSEHQRNSIVITNSRNSRCLERKAIVAITKNVSTANHCFLRRFGDDWVAGVEIQDVIELFSDRDSCLVVEEFVYKPEIYEVGKAPCEYISCLQKYDQRRRNRRMAELPYYTAMPWSRIHQQCSDR